MSTSDGQWKYDLYRTGSRYNDDFVHLTKELLAKPPDMMYPCTYVRNDTQGSVAGIIEWWDSTEQDQVWLALHKNVSVDSIHWTESPEHKACSIADVDKLYGMHRLVIHSGGCNDIVATRVADPLDAPLTDEGYLAVASLTWVEGMKMYIRRVIASKGWKVKDEGGLSGFAPWYCGVGYWCHLKNGGAGTCYSPDCSAEPCYSPPPHQSFAHMLEELSTAAWLDRSTSFGWTDSGTLVGPSSSLLV